LSLRGCSTPHAGSRPARRTPRPRR
jgi:hypothetical protein